MGFLSLHASLRSHLGKPHPLSLPSFVSSLFPRLAKACLSSPFGSSLIPKPRLETEKGLGHSSLPIHYLRS